MYKCLNMVYHHVESEEIHVHGGNILEILLKLQWCE